MIVVPSLKYTFKSSFYYSCRSTIPEGDVQELTPSNGVEETAFIGSSGQNTETSSITDQSLLENTPDTEAGGESQLNEQRGVPVGVSSSSEDLTSRAVQCSERDIDTSSTPQVVSGILPAKTSRN